MKTHYDIIKDAVNFNYSKQGYVELKFVVKVTGIPKIIIKNVLSQMEFKESGIPGQYIKGLRGNDYLGNI